jgi:hypothetical protein
VQVLLYDRDKLEWGGLFGKVHAVGSGRLLLEIPHDLMALLDCWTFGN